ncbi:MAG: TVP38/TMEM64 family protein [Oscillospiraceae bacterium]|nr:TVP38/TMEM64 family protein [Oscillospiraceae bacterium]
MSADKSAARKKILGIVIIAAIFAVVILISYQICRPMLEMAETPEKFREYIADKGFVGILLFMAAIILQVIAAVIPGGPFEVAAGYAFGTFKGALIADIAMTIGSVIVFLFVRRFGMKFIELFFPKEKVESLSFLKTDKKKDFIVFIFFLIPGTPKDLLSYAVGLTDMKLLTWIFITFVGRFPAIFISAVGGSAAGEKKYGMFAVFIGLTVLLCIAGGIFYKKWHAAHSAPEDDASETENTDENSDNKK